MPQSLSIVIRARSDTVQVMQLIENLAAQSTRPREFVVIDSGSSESVLQEFRHLQRCGVRSADRPIGLRLIEIPGSEYQSSSALNHAIRLTCGELVASISQDALPASADYLERLLQWFSDPRIAGSYGRQVPRGRCHPLTRKDLTRTYPAQGRLQQAPDCWFVNTCDFHKIGVLL